MKVLLLGATGSLGSRLLPALLAHNHSVTVFVRSRTKLSSLISPSLRTALTTVVVGDATDAAAIRDALVTHRCDALVNSAGLAAPLPWQAPRMQEIVQAVAGAAVQASRVLGWRIRAWFLGGVGVLDVPSSSVGGGAQIKTYIPVFLEHGFTYSHLSSQPREHLVWSMLCPSMMTAASATIDLLESPRGNRLIASADVPPDWRHTYGMGIPFVGPLLSVLWNAARYTTELEDCADFIAADLAGEGNGWAGKRIGIIAASKGKGD